MKKLLLISDVQTRVQKHIYNYHPMVTNINTLGRYFNYIDNQCYASILLPQKLGHITDELFLPKRSKIFEKHKYSMYEKKYFDEIIPKNTDIVLCGIQTEWCIYHTVKDLKHYGFNNITCISDAMSTQCPKIHIEGLKQLEKFDVNIVNTDIFLKQNCDCINNNFYIDDILRKKKQK
jgi:hypothetical protein